MLIRLVILNRLVRLGNSRVVDGILIGERLGSSNIV